jgi:hypothetical protein
MARSSAGRLITVAHTNRLGSNAAVIGVHEDVGAALQFGVNAARRFELEGAGSGDGRTFDAAARQQVAGPSGLVGGPGDRLAPLLPAAQKQPELCCPASAFLLGRHPPARRINGYLARIYIH